MPRYQFNNGQKLLAICNNEDISIGEATLRRECELIDSNEEIIRQEMAEIYQVMRDSANRGIISDKPSIGGLIGKNGKKMYDYWRQGNYISSELLVKSIAFALAITEENARMGKIAACPTAGACGVVPGVLLALQEQHNYADKDIIMALFNASGIGIIIATNATISGAGGGCQAEVGSASAMVASAIVELCGGTAAMCLHAAAIALKNVLGLVCDPVCGLVEVPCSKRNAMGVGNAITAAEMALAGIESFIPFDEVVATMDKVGKALPSALRETAQGGLAVTKTALEYFKQLTVNS